MKSSLAQIGGQQALPAEAAAAKGSVAEMVPTRQQPEFAMSSRQHRQRAPKTFKPSQPQISDLSTVQKRHPFPRIIEFSKDPYAGFG
jgi:hypothetical protein